jgi:lipopolysaccharide biosynthesis glycosyltransferase
VILSASEGEPVHVATATNAAYLPWCATTLLSAMQSTSGRVVVAHVIVDDDVQARDRDALVRMGESEHAEVRFVEIDRQRLADLPAAVRNHGGAISCARFLLPEQLADVERVVYLDADTLVVDSLAPLVPTPLGPAGLGAVCNVVDPGMRWHLDRLPLQNAGRYLNSGVLLMDLARLRADGAADELLECVRRYAATLLWVDQDALNLVFGDGWTELHPRWNAQNSLWRWPELAADVLGADALRAATTAPAVLHFEGPSLAKPWHYLNSHPYRDRYRAVTAATPWGPVTPEDRTPATAVIARMPAAWRLPMYVRLLALRARVRPTRSG